MRKKSRLIFPQELSLTMMVAFGLVVVGLLASAQPEEEEVCMVSILSSMQMPVAEAIAEAGGYSEMIEDPGTGTLLPNPETKVEFAERYTLELYGRILENHRARKAVEADRETRPPVVLKRRPPR